MLVVNATLDSSLHQARIQSTSRILPARLHNEALYVHQYCPKISKEIALYFITESYILTCNAEI